MPDTGPEGLGFPGLGMGKCARTTTQRLTSPADGVHSPHRMLAGERYPVRKRGSLDRNMHPSIVHMVRRFAEGKRGQEGECGAALRDWRCV